MILIKIFFFPGLLFLMTYALYLQWFDRKVYARMQNRVGPPLFQPVADFLKLLSKQTIVPSSVQEQGMFWILPLISFAAVATSFLFIPVTASGPFYSFPGDLIIVAYLLTLPTLVLALAGWISTTSYSIIGGIRCLSQLFSYEVPFFIALLVPAIAVNSWNIATIATHLPHLVATHPLYMIPLALAFFSGLIALQGKLERKPFDIPDAETELVAGPFTEYSGRLFALFRITLDMEMVVGISLLSAIFLGGANPLMGIPGFVMFLIKTLFVAFLLAAIKSATARIRIDQLISFGWKILAPVSIVALLLQITMINL